MPNAVASTESEGLFKRVFEASPVGIAVILRDFRFVQANDALCRLLGYSREELFSKMWTDVVRPDDACALKDWLERGFAGESVETSKVTQIAGKAGQPIYVKLFVNRLHGIDDAVDSILVIVEDVTEQKIRDERSRQAEKLEAIGTLAGGIGHDFNNILASIDGNIDMAMEDLPESLTEIRGFLAEALKATRRAKVLMQQVLAFGRRRQTEHRPTDLNAIVTEAVRFVRASQPAFIEIETELSALPLVVRADASQLHMAILNLCTNACDAMRGGGTLTVAVGSRMLQDDDEALEAGLYARIVVRDTGLGMEEALIRRIFEPYFTTKPKGEGVGMGLAAVHGIVDSHEGRIRVSSEPSRGSQFEILLPIVEEPVEDEEDWPLDDAPKGNGELILFVDDESSIIAIGERTLTRLNYRVVSAMESKQALELFRATPDAFDLVITDQTMPKLTGIEMAREMLLIRPAIPIILCTGYSEKVTEEIAREAGVRKLLTKPILPPVLAQVIRSELRPSS